MRDEASILAGALKLGTEQERREYLSAACEDNSQLRQELEQLLQAHRAAGSFLENSPAEFDFPTGVGLSLSDKSLGAYSSVLKLFDDQLDEVPRVVLRESDSEPEGPIVRPAGRNDGSSACGRYDVRGEIARGGMGAVLQARDRDLGRDLAIKVLLESHADKPEVQRRFVEEAQIGGQLQHPGIAPVYELGRLQDQRPFFTMKLVKGRTLSALLSERKNPTDDRARFLGIFEQICQAMAYAHSRGVIHRDLKPANVMVGAFGEVQVMDWGLAKVLKEGGIHDEQRERPKDEADDISVIQTVRSVGSDTPEGVGSETRAGSILGTPAYLPPEQALGHVDEMNERSDVFGLGAILCVILTGEPPYVANTGAQIYRMAQKAKLDDCYARLDDCQGDSDLIALAKVCLQPELKDRPRNAGEVGQRISRYLESVETKLRETEIERAAEAARAVESRKRLRVTLALAASVLLMFSAVGGGWMWTQHQSAERLAFVTQNINNQLSDARLHQQSAGQIDLDGQNGFDERVRELRLALENARKAAEFTQQAPVSRELRASVDHIRLQLESDLAVADQEAQRAAADQVILEELELIRFGRADRDSEQVTSQVTHSSQVGRDEFLQFEIDSGPIAFEENTVELYERAFRNAGIDVATMDINQAAQLIRQSRIRETYISALDDWMHAIEESRDEESLNAPLDSWDTLVPKEMISTVSTLELLPDGSILATPPSNTDDLHYQIEFQPGNTTVAAIRLDVLPHDSLPNSGPGYHPTGNYHLGEIEVFLERNGELERQPVAQAVASYSWPTRPISRAVDGDRSTDWHVWGKLGKPHYAILRFATSIQLHDEDQLVIRLLQEGKYALGCFRISTRESVEATRHTQLLQLVNAVDDNVWRTQLRNALIANDAETVSRLVENPESRYQSPGLITWLGAKLRASGRIQEAVSLLEGGQLLHPGDFWVNYELARSLQAADRSAEAMMAMRAALSARPQSLLPYMAFIENPSTVNHPMVWQKIANVTSSSQITHHRIGSLFLQENMIDEAVASFRKAIAIDPNNPSAHSDLGYALGRRGDIEEAIAEFRRAIDIDPNNALTHAQLGYHLRIRGDAEEAIAEYRRAIEIDPNASNAHDNLGFTLMAQGNAEEAIAEFRRAIEIDPNNFYAHSNLGMAFRKMGNFEEAVASYRKALALNPSEVRLVNNLGVALALKHKYSEAISTFRKILELDRTYVMAHYNIALAWLNYGKPEEAIVEFRKSIELDPNNVDAYAYLGLALCRQGMPEEAVIELRKGIERDPNHSEAQGQLGYALCLLDKHSEAENRLRKAIELGSNNADWYAFLGFALLRQGKSDEAIIAIRIAIKLNPSNAQAHSNLGTALAEKGQFKEAIVEFRRAIDIDPNNADAQNNLASCLVLCREATPEECQEAVELAQKASKNGSPGWTRWTTLALAHYRLDHSEAARKALEKAMQLGGKEEPANWLLLAMVCRRSGEPAQAIEWFEKVREWRQSHPLRRDVELLFEEAASLLGVDRPETTPEATETR